MRKRHSTRIKLKALRLFQKGFGPYVVAKKLRLGTQTVSVWHNFYRAGNPAWVRSEYVRSDPELLAQAVREYTSSEAGFFALSARYGISPASIRNGYLNQLRYGVVSIQKCGKDEAMNKHQLSEKKLSTALARLDAGAAVMGRREYKLSRARIIVDFSMDSVIEESSNDPKKSGDPIGIRCAAVNRAVALGVSLNMACNVAGIYRSTYEGRMEHKKKTDKDTGIIRKIIEIQEANNYTYGIGRIDVTMRMCGIVVNHKRIERLMRENGLNARVRKRKKDRGPCTDVPQAKREGLPDNVLNRIFLAFRPGEKLVSDVTYLPLEGGGWCYVSLVKDLATSEIVACVTSLTQNLQLGFDTLAQLRGKTRTNCIFHTDQGVIYTHPAFRGMLESMGLVQSLSRKGNCLDNAAMESFNGRMKCEWFYPRFGRRRWKLTFEQATALVNEYVHYYNERRIQKKLGWLTPVQYREKLIQAGL